MGEIRRMCEERKINILTIIKTKMKAKEGRKLCVLGKSVESSELSS